MNTNEILEDEIIFLIHGFAGSSLNMKLIEDYLKLNKIQSYSFDLPGHGKDIANFNKKGKKDYLLKTLEEFNKFKNYKKITVVGFSMGACLAILLLNKIDEEIKKKVKLILISPAISVNTKIFPSFYKLFLASIYKKKLNFNNKNPGCNNPEYIKYYSPINTNISTKRFLDLYSLIRLSKKAILKINIPLMIIHSKKDRISFYEKTFKIFKKIKNKDKVFITLKKSNHFIQLDYEHHMVEKLILLFHLDKFDQIERLVFTK